MICQAGLSEMLRPAAETVCIRHFKTMSVSVPSFWNILTQFRGYLKASEYLSEEIDTALKKRSHAIARLDWPEILG
jgi:hypothetical protein